MTAAVPVVNAAALRRYWEAAAPKVRRGGGEHDDLAAIQRHHRAAHDESNATFRALSGPGRKVLDLYVGVGVDAVDAARAGAEAVFAGLAAAHVRETMRLAAAAGVQPAVTVAAPDRMPFASGGFDVVLARGYLMFVPDPAAALAEMRRILAPGGTLVAVLYNRNSWFTGLKKLSGEPIVHPADPPVVNLHRRADLQPLFSGFSDVTIRQGRFPVRDPDRSGLLASLYNAVLVPGYGWLPGAWRERLGFYFIVTARRPV